MFRRLLVFAAATAALAACDSAMLRGDLAVESDGDGGFIPTPMPDGALPNRADGAVDGGMTASCDPNLSNQPPRAPEIFEPAHGRMDVVATELIIRPAPFDDPDGDLRSTTEVEIWRIAGDTLIERVWRTVLDDKSGAAQIALAAGAFEGSASSGGLKEWEDYAIRARYEDASGACSRWSEWGPLRKFRTDDGSSYLFDPSVVRTIELEIPPESWAAINAQANPPGCVRYDRDYHPGAMVFEGVRFENVGIRIKGGCGSSRSLDGKPGLKVNLNWRDPNTTVCPRERRLYGQKTLTLNNGVQDQSAARERLGYRVYRAAGVPAPRVANVRVIVNGQLYGLYQQIESPGRRFLSRWFSNNDGVMYEGSYWCDLIPANLPPDASTATCLDLEFKPDVCDIPSAGEDPLDYELLGDLVQQIQMLAPDAFFPEVTSFFEYDTFLSMWAVEALIGHWDAYSFHITNNYRVYHHPEMNKWTMIPWGIDQTFAGDLDPWSSASVLVNRCLEERDCEAAFAAKLREAAALFDSLDLATEAQQVHAFLRPFVEEDPRKEYDLARYDAEHAELVEYIRTRSRRIEEILAQHGY